MEQGNDRWARIVWFNKGSAWSTTNPWHFNLVACGWNWSEFAGKHFLKFLSNRSITEDVLSTTRRLLVRQNELFGHRKFLRQPQISSSLIWSRFRLNYLPTLKRWVNGEIWMHSKNLKTVVLFGWFTTKLLELHKVLRVLASIYSCSHGNKSLKNLNKNKGNRKHLSWK